MLLRRNNNELFLGFFEFDDNKKGMIFLNGVEFANFWTQPIEPEKRFKTKADGKVIFNRGTVAIQLGVSAESPFFDTHIEMLEWTMNQIEEKQKEKGHFRPDFTRTVYVESRGDQRVGINSDQVKIEFWREDLDETERANICSEALAFAEEIGIDDTGGLSVRFDDQCPDCGSIVENGKCPCGN